MASLIIKPLNMTNIKLKSVSVFLNEIKSFRKREILSECWEILWRTWNTKLLDEYFADNHLNKINGLIGHITCDLYYNAKSEIINEFDKVLSKPNATEKLYLNVIAEIKDTIELFSSDNLNKHIAELNKEIKQGKVIINPPRFIRGKYDTDDESQWVQTQKPDIIDLSEIFFFRKMINPMLLALENLLLVTEISAKRGKKEIMNLFVGIPNSDEKIITLPSLLKTPKLIEIINSWLLKENFIEPYDDQDVNHYIWIGKNDNEEKGIYSKVNVSDSDRYFDTKINKFSSRFQVAAFARWLFNTKLLTMTKYNASLVGRSIINYYNLENNSSNQKAFRDEKAYEKYLVYFISLKRILDKSNSD